MDKEHENVERLDAPSEATAAMTAADRRELLRKAARARNPQGVDVHTHLVRD